MKHYIYVKGKHIATYKPLKQVNWVKVWLISLGFIAALVLIANEMTDTTVKQTQNFKVEAATITPTVIETPLLGKTVETDTPVITTIMPTATSMPTTTVIPTKNAETLTLEEKIRSTFSDAPDVAIALAKAESGMRCNAWNVNKNNSTDSGLLQINSLHTKRIAKHGWTYSDMQDCNKNLVIAHEIYTEQGFKPWVAYTSGAYLKYLKK